jgi:hypothetical protein
MAAGLACGFAASLAGTLWIARAYGYRLKIGRGRGLG